MPEHGIDEESGPHAVLRAFSCKGDHTHPYWLGTFAQLALSRAARWAWSDFEDRSLADGLRRFFYSSISKNSR